MKLAWHIRIKILVLLGTLNLLSCQGLWGGQELGQEKEKEISCIRKYARASSEQDKGTSFARMREAPITLSNDEGSTDKHTDNWAYCCQPGQMRQAVNNIPTQRESYPHHEWSCGINSAAKAINMFGQELSKTEYFSSFLPHAPRGFHKKSAVAKGIGMQLAGLATEEAGWLLAPFTGGTSVVIGLLAQVGLSKAGTAAIMTGAWADCDVGPSPRQLADYISITLPDSQKASYESYDDFGDCAEAIRDALQEKSPVIIFLSYSIILAHYVNVVGVRLDAKNLPEEFVIMDTDNKYYRLTWQDIATLMKRQFTPYAILATTSADYHIVRFPPKEPT